jgi:hypothetical protein
MTVLVAVPDPEDGNDGWAYDGLNEVLRPATLEDGYAYHDYAISLLADAPVYDTGNEVEEGECFNDFAWDRGLQKEEEEWQRKRSSGSPWVLGATTPTM